jgi:excisionase family DNA binding protein
MIIVDMPKLRGDFMTNNKEILTAKEVAQYLKVHPLTVHKYAREGKIPAFKIGTDWRFHKHYIDKWIKEKLTFNAQHKDRRKSLGENNSGELL